VEELIEHMPGPDFPTGGQILGTDGFDKHPISSVIRICSLVCHTAKT
jgi:hypothetical protein